MQKQFTIIKPSTYKKRKNGYEEFEIYKKYTGGKPAKIIMLGEKVIQIPKITDLAIFCEKIDKIPEEIFGFGDWLKKLYLTHNQLTIISPQIKKLKQLKELYLTFNNITNLPEEIKELVNLEELDLRDNLINYNEQEKIKKWLPKCICKFYYPSTVFASKI